MLTIRRLASDAEIAAAFSLMLELRPRLAGEDFVGLVRAQEPQGYRLVGGFEADGTLVALAGYRVTRNLSRGPHLFVDDLVTASAAQGRGYGRQMLAWLGRTAVEAELATVWLDSRVSARGFYERAGFEWYSSVPCRIEADKL